jgi:quinol monooxygenase YgiN
MSVMIHAVVTLVAPPGKREGFLRSLRALLDPTRGQPGCLLCHLYEDVEEPGTFTLVEEWDRLADFVNRLRSEAYRQLLRLMELSPASPGVQFHVVPATMGLEAVVEARLETAAWRPGD